MMASLAALVASAVTPYRPVSFAASATGVTFALRQKDGVWALRSAPASFTAVAMDVGACDEIPRPQEKALSR